MSSRKFFSKQQSISAALAITASVAAVAAFVYGATTIGTNVSVDGTLTVLGASTLTGNVGVASTTPWGLLSVNHAGGQVGFVVGSSTATSFIIDQNGRIGIGTTGPTEKLHIVGNSLHELSASRSLKIFLGGESVATLHAIDSAGSNRHLRLAGYTLRLETGDSAASTFTERLRITDIGNVGVGDTNPTRRLTVYAINESDSDIGLRATSTTGSINYDWTFGIDRSDGGKFKIASSTALGTNDRLVIDGTGNIGIGTTTPFSRFHVTQGASATTTVNFGEVGSATSKACFNAKNVSGADISFYFSAANALVVENNLCR